MSFKLQDPKVRHPKIRRALWRGLRRRCPHCGHGPLFKTWFGLHAECPVCHLRYEQRAGDTWAFWLIGDRLFIAALLTAIVVGFRSTSTWHVFVLFGAVAIPLIWTMPHRLGVCVGLDYLSRVYMGQPSEVPPSHSGVSHVSHSGVSHVSHVSHSDVSHSDVSHSGDQDDMLTDR